MVCPRCGAPLADGSLFCDRCGASTAVQPTTSQSTAAQATFASPQTVLPTEPEKTSGKALGSLITGVFGLLLFPAAFVAIVLGHVSRSEIRRSNGRLQGSGMALGGLILGYMGIAFIPLILIVAAIAIPNLLRARIAANESSAFRAVRRITTAEVTYYLANPRVGYTCTLSDLAGNERISSVAKARLIDDGLASGTKYGYQFVLQNCVRPEKGEGSYQVVAYPVSRDQTGVKTFCSDETGVVRFDTNGSPDECLAHGERMR
jgi:type IV pilus assembly protein PilA